MRPFLSFDVETSGELPEFALQPWRVKQDKAWITTFATAYRDGEHIRSAGEIMTDVARPPNRRHTRDRLAATLEDAIERKVIMVGWNLQFDIGWLLAYGLEGLVRKLPWLDGQRLWKHLDNTPSFLGNRHYNLLLANKTFEPVYFGGYKTDVDYHDASVEARKHLLVYNCKDNEATLLHVERFWPQLTEKQQQVVKIEAACIWMVAKANLTGMRVSDAKALELDHAMRSVGNNLAAKLAPLGCTEKDIRSPAKLRKLMFEKWNLDVIKYTIDAKTGLETDKASTDKEVIKELATDHDRVLWLGQWRESLNLRTKFVTSLRRSIIYNDEGNITHPDCILFSTYTSRMTYGSKQGRGVNERPTGFALHQMKRGPTFRSAIVAPDGHLIVEADAAGQEFRWMAILSGDPVMLELCHGGDPHSFLAAEIYQVDYEQLKAEYEEGDKEADNKRKLGKVGNLCIAEGTRVLTDRGFCNIEHVRIDDRVWDGVEFVRHSGVSFSGTLPVMSYDGLTATHSHKVFVNGKGQQDFSHAARHGWLIEPPMGADWSSVCRSAIRIVDGLIRRAFNEVWRSLFQRAMRLWQGSRRQLGYGGVRPIGAVQGVCYTTTASSGWQSHCDIASDERCAKAGQRDVSKVQQSKRSVVSQLRWTWHQIQVCIRSRGCGVDHGEPAASDIQSRRDRPRAERWTLRAWKFAAGDKASQSRQSPTRCYDIVDCGPRSRFVAAGLVVHNSLQYRTSKKRLRIAARTDYGMKMTEEMAAHVWTTYRRTYERVPTYWRTQIATAKMQGYVETLAGRRLDLTGDWTEYEWSLGSAAINYPVQGTGGEQKYLAMMMVQGILNRYDAMFAWDLHDGIYFYVPEDKAMSFAAALKKLLDNLPYKQAWDFVPSCPLPWDVKIGPNWGELKGVKL